METIAPETVEVLDIMNAAAEKLYMDLRGDCNIKQMISAAIQAYRTTPEYLQREKAVEKLVEAIRFALPYTNPVPAKFELIESLKPFTRGGVE